MNICKVCQKEARDLKQNRSTRKNINNIYDANSWLQENHPNYQIIQWGGKSSEVSRFIDLKRNVEFDYKFARFKDKIKKYPNRIFSPTPQELQGKIRNSFKEKYGEECALQVSKFKRKAQETNIKRYGVDNIMKSAKFKKQKGIVKLVEGKTIQEWADDLGISYSHFRNVMAYEGLDVAKNLKKNKTNLESKMELILKETEKTFIYNEWFQEAKIRPDFLLPQENIIIECNGFRWHSDEFIKNKNFHQSRLKKIERNGYSGLFFNSDEILNKTSVVKSIIKNKIGISNRLFARKCKVLSISSKVAREFFIENHLMGNGSGRTYSLISNDEKIAAAIQVRWTRKDLKFLDISRFCTSNETSVVGGYSKLIKHVLLEEKPNKIQTFVDRRYGSGIYLSQFGFKKETEGLSFVWTDGKKAFHRMKFPANSGYERGLFKIWDCGQAKWVLQV